MLAAELLRTFGVKPQPADAFEHLAVFLRTAPPEEVEAFAVDALAGSAVWGNLFRLGAQSRVRCCVCAADRPGCGCS
jgi:hypothetical protein